MFLGLTYFHLKNIPSRRWDVSLGFFLTDMGVDRGVDDKLLRLSQSMTSLFHGLGIL